MTDLEITQLPDCPGISLESEHGGCSCLYAALDRMAAALKEEGRKPRLSIDQARILDNWTLESVAAKVRIRDLASDNDHLSSALAKSENEVATLHETALRLKEVLRENADLRERINEEHSKAQSAEEIAERLAASMTRTLAWTEDMSQKSKEKISQLEELVETLSSKTLSGERKLEVARDRIKELQEIDLEKEATEKLREVNASLQEHTSLLEKTLAETESRLLVLNNHRDHLQKRVESLEAALSENVHKFEEKELELAAREDSINKLNQSLLAIKSVLKETS